MKKRLMGFLIAVRMLCDELPGFGEVLAIDGKALESYARPRRAESEKPYDGRRDIDANFGVKTYKEEQGWQRMGEDHELSDINCILLWIFNSLVRMLCDELPFQTKGLWRSACYRREGFGELCEAKARESEKPYDGELCRRDIDANFGVKTYKGKNKDGSVWEKTMSWFGYKLHLIVDAVYELPVAFRVTQASRSEIKEARTLVDEMALRLPEIVDRCMYLTGDKGYDDTKMTTKLWDEYRIKPVIDIRNAWRDGEETKLVTGRENVVYDYKGTVYCYSPEDYRRCEMVPGGFEKDRDALKHLCPAKYYGVECRGKDACPVKSGVRIPLHEDRRVFTPVARPSAKWKKIYDKRTAVERVNSRIDRVFGFEDHCIRGLRKMNLRCSLALVTMLAMALGRIRTKQEHKLRSLVQAA
jgi:hypothetical protein